MRHWFLARRYKIVIKLIKYLYHIRVTGRLYAHSITAVAAVHSQVKQYKSPCSFMSIMIFTFRYNSHTVRIYAITQITVPINDHRNDMMGHRSMAHT